MVKIKENDIPIGKEQALHQKQLAQILGISEVCVKRGIRQLRKQGVEICSNNRGYWRPLNDEERKEYLKFMYKSSLSRFISAKPTKKNLDRVPGQLSFGELNE